MRKYNKGLPTPRKGVTFDDIVKERIKKETKKPDGTNKSLKGSKKEKERMAIISLRKKRTRDGKKQRIINRGAALVMASMLAVTGIVGAKAKEIIDFVYIKTGEAEEALKAYEKKMAKNDNDKKYKDDKVNTLDELEGLKANGVNLQEEFGISEESFEKAMSYYRHLDGVINGEDDGKFDHSEAEEFYRQLCFEKLMFASGTGNAEFLKDENGNSVLFMNGEPFFLTGLPNNALPGNNYDEKTAQIINRALNGFSRKKGILDEIDVVGEIADLATAQITCEDVISPYTGTSSKKIKTSHGRYSKLIKGKGENSKTENSREP